MLEIDIIKASTAKPLPSYYDDADISETDTALNTPTGSMRRLSSTSSSHSTYSTFKRRPSVIPSSINNSRNVSCELLLHKIQALEMEVNQLVENEIDLKSQLLMLRQQKQKQGKQSALDRINKHTNRFLTDKQQHQQKADDLIGIELPALFYEDNQVNPTKDIQADNDPNDTVNNAIDIPSVLVFRLKAMIDHFLSSSKNKEEKVKEHGEAEAFCTELVSTLDSWQSYQFTAVLDQQLERKKEQDRVTRLLEALHKSLLRNKTMQKDMALLTKQYTSDLKDIIEKEHEEPKKKKAKTCRATTALHDDCEKTKLLLECQIQTLETALSTCQDERDEYETRSQMKQRELGTMMEELEDTKQQRLRYKTQASRLRAGLEEIQKKKRAENESDSEEEEEEADHAREAIRLMYKEAERQALDLDRECKRQALTLNSLRKELKSNETMKAEKNKQIEHVEQTNRSLTRKIQLLELQLTTTNSKYDILNTTTGKDNEDKDDADADDAEDLYHAKIHALQISLKAAKSDAVVQRTRIYQLERQCMIDPTQYIIRMQDMFKKQAAATTIIESADISKRLADGIEFEQREWKQRHLVQFQKKYDSDLLRVNREILTLSGRLTEIENEMDITQCRHLEQVSLLKYQIGMDFEKKLQRLQTLQQSKERDLENQLEVLSQKNQTLQDEIMIMCSRNLMMAHKLGKIDIDTEK